MNPRRRALGAFALNVACLQAGVGPGVRWASALRGLGLLGVLLAAAVQATALAQTPVPPDNAESEVAALRVVHLSPDAPQVDLLIDGVLTLRDQSFTTISSYLLLEPGRHEISLFPHRGPEIAAETVQPLEPLSMTVDLRPGSYYTVVASGFFDPPAEGATAGTLDIRMEPGTRAEVRGPRNYLVTLSEAAQLANLTPGRYRILASREGFLSAEYEVELGANAAVTVPINLQEGEAEDEDAAPVAAESKLEVTERPWYKTQLQLYEDDFTTLPPAGQVFVRFIHAAPASPPVDAHAVRDPDGDGAGKEVLGGLAFPNASPYLPVPTDTGTLLLRVAGSDLELGELSGLSLESGTIYTIYLTASVASDALTPIPYVDAVLRGTLP